MTVHNQHCDPWKVTVVDDGTESNETRLGAVRDIQFAMDQLDLDDDMLVIAGDNVLNFSLTFDIAWKVLKDILVKKKNLQKSYLQEILHLQTDFSYKAYHMHSHLFQNDLLYIAPPPQILFYIPNQKYLGGCVRYW